MEDESWSGYGDNPWSDDTYTGSFPNIGVFDGSGSGAGAIQQATGAEDDPNNYGYDFDTGKDDSAAWDAWYAAQGRIAEGEDLPYRIKAGNEADDPFKDTDAVNKGWYGDLLGYIPSQVLAVLTGKASPSTIGLGSGLTGGRSVADLFRSGGGSKSSGGRSSGGPGGGGGNITNVVNAGDDSSLLKTLVAMTAKQNGSQSGEGSVGAADRAERERQRAEQLVAQLGRV